MRRVIVLAAVLVLTFAATSWADNAVRVSMQNLPSQIGWVEDEFIVVFSADARRNLDVKRTPSGGLSTSIASVQGLIEHNDIVGFRRHFGGAKLQPAGSRFPDLTGHYKVKLRSGADLQSIMAAFAVNPNVDHVEKIGIHPVYATPNDPYYQESPNPDFPYDQWHYWDTHGIDADLAWDANAGDATVVVGILDSGTRYFHLDLGGDSAPWGPDSPFAGGNIFINSGETPSDGIDNDGNGYIDDVIGWDFVTEAGGPGVDCIDQDCSIADNDPDDGNGHGTHVSGTVAAISNNNLLVAGVAGGYSDGTTSGVGNGVRVLPCRIGYHARYLGMITGIVRMDWAAEAMHYVANLVDAGVNVASINCSWGSSNSGGLDVAVDNLLAHDVVIVVAAGNSNSSSADYLGSRGDCLDVAATDINGNGASFTNYGSWIDVAAPGVDVLSTYRNPDDSDLNNHYIAVMSGTSMSAPHVAGIVGLLESCIPSLSGSDKYSLIVSNTDPYTDTRDLGSGIANAKKAFDAAGCSDQPCTETTPVADFNGSPTSGDAPLTVNFSDLSTNSPDTWLWDFGDGGSSTAQNPMYEYTTAGTYTVTLTASNCAGSDIAVKTDYITVNPPPCTETTPVADFSGSPTSGDAPLTVSFSDLSTNNPDTWLWDFGDGGSSTAQDPTYEYTTAGTYTVTLTASNCAGSDIATKTDYITVSQSSDYMYVFDMVVGRKVAGPNNSGTCTVTIYSSLSQPVDGASVYVTATGPVSGDYSGTTGADGTVYFETAKTRSPGSDEWCFEVTAVTHVTYTYDPDANNVTKACESGPVYAQEPANMSATSSAGLTSWIYPNPFNAGANIAFSLETAGHVGITVYDVLGRPVRNLAAGVFSAGKYTVPFDGTDDSGRTLGTGMYFYRITTPGYVESRKMVLLK